MLAILVSGIRLFCSAGLPLVCAVLHNLPYLLSCEFAVRNLQSRPKCLAIFSYVELRAHYIV